MPPKREGVPQESKKIKVDIKKDSVLTVAFKTAMNDLKHLTPEKALEKVEREFRRTLEESPAHGREHVVELDNTIATIRAELIASKKK